MLDSAKGFPCQAANFQRAFRTVPEAYGLGLLLSDQNPEKKTNLIRLIQVKSLQVHSSDFVCPKYVENLRCEGYRQMILARNSL